MSSPTTRPRTSQIEPDLTSKGAFIKSALGGGRQQTVAVLAAQGGQARMMVRSKAPNLPIIVNVGVVLVRTIGTQGRRVYEDCSATKKGR